MHYFLSRHAKLAALAIFACISLFVTDIIASESVMHMHFELNDTSVPMANVEINGKRQELMIDTGSQNALHLTKEFMGQLSGLEIDPEKERSTDLTGKVFLNDRFHIPQLTINGMMFKDIQGVSLTPWGMNLIGEDRLPSSMVIGLGLFKGKAVLIDYKSQRLSVADHPQSLSVDAADWIALPLRLTQEGIVVRVSQRMQGYNMVLDTGASVSVFWKNRIKPPFAGISCRVVMVEMENEGCMASEFQLGEIGAEGIKLNAVLMDGAFENVDMDGVIGNDFFERFAVLIDFPGQRLLIKENILPR
ncbi:gag-polyprotein putative aspartyl protease [compost metagenome]